MTHSVRFALRVHFVLIFFFFSIFQPFVNTMQTDSAKDERKYAIATSYFIRAFCIYCSIDHAPLIVNNENQLKRGKKNSPQMNLMRAFKSSASCKKSQRHRAHIIRIRFNLRVVIIHATCAVLCTFYSRYTLAMEMSYLTRVRHKLRVTNCDFNVEHLYSLFPESTT